MSEAVNKTEQRKAIIRVLRGMIGIKFPDIENERSVRVAKALEFKLFRMAENDWGSYSDLNTLHDRLQEVVAELQEAGAV